MTTLPTITPSIDAAEQMKRLAHIGRLYLQTHYCPAPLTAAEVQDHAERLRELGRLCREMKK